MRSLGSYGYDLFISYSHTANIPKEWVDKFIEGISDEYLLQTSEPLRIFKDTILKHGERWERRIFDALKSSKCLLAIMSPAYFKSTFCRQEWEFFCKEEIERGIDELIIPVYYIEYKPFEDVNEREKNEWLENLYSRQYFDLREYRHKGTKIFKTNPSVKEKIGELVQSIQNSLIKVSASDESSLKSELTFKVPIDVHRYDWLDRIAKWFSENYPLSPFRSISKVIDHSFDVIKYAQGTGQQIFFEKIMELGKELQKHFPENLPNNQLYHLDILKLLELGIHYNLHHLFMIPQINKESLLSFPLYSKLLLATRYLATGNHVKAIELASNLRGSCVALYVLGQCNRRKGLYDNAKLHLLDAIDLVNRRGSSACEYAQLVCEENLLRAEIMRALGVVYRKLKQKEKAEECYAKATKYAEETIKTSSQPETSDSDNTINVEFELNPRLVIAGIQFSHGYYWYEQKNYDKAETLFNQSINALRYAEEIWDSPYTRLAIVKLCSGNIEEAKDIFLRARKICELTRLEKNREAPLSKALCTLGLKIIEISFPKKIGHSLIDADPLRDLEEALSYEPPLEFGPLECHLNDAKFFYKEELEPAKNIVNRFIKRLEDEIMKLQKKIE